MAGISQSRLFASLGAPLRNVRWSWGAVRPSDGTVFLRVWRDLVESRDGAWFVRIGNEEKLRADPRKAGRRERMEHLRLVAGGARCFLIMCQAKDPQANTREIDDFNRDQVFPAGRGLKEGSQWWVEVLQGVSVEEAAKWFAGVGSWVLLRFCRESVSQME
jgi:hypothetical protein